jgi:hypothetical protein
LVGICLAGTFLLAGCGGSSSETPEPVRPDTWQLKLRHKRQLGAAKDAEPRHSGMGDFDAEDSAPALSTWGKGSKR